MSYPRIPDWYVVVGLNPRGEEYRTSYRYHYQAMAHMDRLGTRFVRFEETYEDGLCWVCGETDGLSNLTHIGGGRFVHARCEKEKAHDVA